MDQAMQDILLNPLLRCANVRIDVARGEDARHVLKYGMPHYASNLDPDMLDIIRKSAAARREEMLAEQKLCAAQKNSDAARFYKEEIDRTQRIAITLIVAMGILFLVAGIAYRWSRRAPPARIRWEHT